MSVKNNGVTFNKVFPDRLEWWNYEKNILDPNKIKDSDDIKAWFVCDKGHEFYRNPFSKITSGIFCPDCSHPFISFKEKYPEIVENYWDFNKNEKLPEDTPFKTSKLIYLKCPEGHEFSRNTDVFLYPDRTLCKDCRIINNSLKFNKPKIANYYDNDNNSLKNIEVSVNTNDLFWWKCPMGHEFQEKISIMSKSNGCYYCEISIDGVDARLIKDYIKTIYNGEISFNDKNLIKNNTVDIYLPSLHKAIDFNGDYWFSNVVIRRKTNNEMGPFEYLNSKYKFAQGIGVDLIYIWEHDWLKHNEYIKNEVINFVNGESYDKEILTRKRSIVSNDTCLLCHPEKRRKKSGRNYKTQPKIIDTDYYRFVNKEKNNEDLIKSLTMGSNIKVWWICSNGHEKFAEPRTMSIAKNYNCQLCEIDVTTDNYKKYWEMVTKYWDYDNNDRSPKEFSHGSGYNAYWICELGHSFQMKISNKSKGQNCQYCTNRLILKGFNDLLSHHPEIKDYWDWDKNILSPEDYLYGSAKEVYLKCSQGHETSKKIVNIKWTDICVKCNPNASIIPGINDLATIEKEIVDNEWDYEKNILKPTEVGIGKKTNAWWKCSEGHSYEYEIKGKIQLKLNCPYCNNRRVLEGFNDIASQYPEIIKLWDEEKNDKALNELTKSGEHTYYWHCKTCDTYWSDTLKNMVYLNNKCPYCANKRIRVGFNDIFTIFPMLKKEWNFEKNKEIDPYCLTYGSSANKVWWKCLDKGHEWLAAPNSRTFKNKYRACPECSGDTLEKSLYYFVRDTINCEASFNTKKIISPLELDIYMESLNKAIEFNGDYWHCEAIIRKTKNSKSAVEYHSMKFNKCKEKDIELIFVWEHDWIVHNDLVKGELLKFLNGENYNKELFNKFESIMDTEECENCE